MSLLWREVLLFASRTFGTEACLVVVTIPLTHAGKGGSCVYVGGWMVVAPGETVDVETGCITECAQRLLEQVTETLFLTDTTTTTANTPNTPW